MKTGTEFFAAMVLLTANAFANPEETLRFTADLGVSRSVAETTTESFVSGSGTQTLLFNTACTTVQEFLEKVPLELTLKPTASGTSGKLEHIRQLPDGSQLRLVVEGLRKSANEIVLDIQTGGTSGVSGSATLHLPLTYKASQDIDLPCFMVGMIGAGGAYPSYSSDGQRMDTAPDTVQCDQSRAIAIFGNSPGGYGPR
ncbi:MAG: hypothetical protein HYZ71_17215 [Deltaproteobacteria bacterium]|nr:hypothetical protein [Deltaproteobacteria bacterium]